MCSHNACQYVSITSQNTTVVALCVGQYVGVNSEAYIHMTLRDQVSDEQVYKHMIDVLQKKWPRVRRRSSFLAVHQSRKQLGTDIMTMKAMSEINKVKCSCMGIHSFHPYEPLCRALCSQTHFHSKGVQKDCWGLWWPPWSEYHIDGAYRRAFNVHIDLG